MNRRPAHTTVTPIHRLKSCSISTTRPGVVMRGVDQGVLIEPGIVMTGVGEGVDVSIESVSIDTVIELTGSVESVVKYDSDMLNTRQQKQST